MFNVTASSQGNQTSAVVSVTITDINDNSPNFTSTSYTFPLTENTPISPTVIIGTVVANDADQDGNQPVHTDRHTDRQTH